MIGNASRAVDDRSLGTDQVDVQTRVHVLFHQLRRDVVRRRRRSTLARRGRLRRRRDGRWRSGPSSETSTSKFGIATFTATFTNFSFSKIASVHDTVSAALSCAAETPVRQRRRNGRGDAGAFSVASSANDACDRQSRFGDLEASVHWDVGPLEFTAQMGHRFGDSYDVTADSRRWTLGERHDVAQRPRRRRSPAAAVNRRCRCAASRRGPSAWPGSSSRTGRSRSRLSRSRCRTRCS